MGVSHRADVRAVGQAFKIRSLAVTDHAAGDMDSGKVTPYNKFHASSERRKDEQEGKT